ncbi:MAG: hypothetical protein PUG51_00150 [Firmicutes bacterium]|nr:hypothetical protein [Bacillota bacterium]
MKKELKKSCNIALNIILCFSIMFLFNPTIGNAREESEAFTINDIVTSNNLSTKIDKNEVESAIVFFEKMGIDVRELNITEDGLISFHTDKGKHASEVVFTKISDKSLSVEIYEGTKHDSMTFKDDGTCILNGKPVTVTVTDANGNVISNDSIQLDAYYWMTNCPVYSSSDYTYTKDSYLRNYNIELATLISAATVVAVTAAASTALAASGIPAASMLVEEIGSTMYHSILDSATTSDGTILKMKVKYYYHKTKKVFMVTSSQGCEKERIGHYGARGVQLGSYKWLYKYFLQSGA